MAINKDNVLDESWNNVSMQEIRTALQQLLTALGESIDAAQDGKPVVMDLSMSGTVLTATITLADGETEVSGSVDLAEAISAGQAAVEIVDNLFPGEGLASKALSADAGVQLNQKTNVILEHMHWNNNSPDSLFHGQFACYYNPTTKKIHQYYGRRAGQSTGVADGGEYEPSPNVSYYDKETGTVWLWKDTGESEYDLVLAYHPWRVIGAVQQGSVAPTLGVNETSKLFYLPSSGELCYLWKVGGVTRSITFEPDSSKVYSYPTSGGSKAVRWNGTQWVDVGQTITAGTGIAINGSQISVETGSVEANETKPVSGKDVKEAIDNAVEGALTDVTIAAISETDAKFFIRDGALCINTDSFVVVTAAPTISHVINQDGTATVTIAHSDVNALVEYSLDGGTTWDDYSQPLTINTAGEHTIKARAQVNGSPMSDVVTDTVTVVESSMPTLTTTKTSSDMTLTATGSGTVVMTVDNVAQTSPYTVSRTTSNQTLSVEVTNKEDYKLIATLTQSVTVPKLTVVSVKIRNFVKRVVDNDGHLIFGEPSNFDWSTVSADDWAEGYDDTTDPSSPTFNQAQVSNTDLLAVLEATQEKYDEHTLLLGAEPELDFLGYKGTKDSPTYLYSVNPRCDADALKSVSIDNNGLLVAATEWAPTSSNNGNYHIKWTNYSKTYSTRFAPRLDSSQNDGVSDFSRLYISGENGLLEYQGTSGAYYYCNAIIQGFPNTKGRVGAVGQGRITIDGVERSILKVTHAQSTNVKCIDSDGLRSLLLVRSGNAHDASSAITVAAYINGSATGAESLSTTPSYEVGSTNIGYAYMQMKANSPTLILMY